MAGPTLKGSEDVEDFLEQVDEVHRLIDGLKAGTISPEYIDTKLEYKKQKEQEVLETTKQRPAGRGPAPVSQSSPTQQEEQGDAEDQDDEAERRESAMAKVKELMANRDRKLRARARYEEYVKSQDKTQFGTDYTKWDIWCPEDEEDDLINSIGPNTPQFRAMEKDIDERHRQMVERRQLAERARVRGNEAYQSRQYSEALRCYEQGLESERTNMTLHANAAMAALKMGCYVQAMEHCDKVLSIAEFLHNNKKHPLCLKALQRRAEAFRALQQHGRAVADLEWAHQLEPDNTEVAKQLAKARQEDEEARKQRAIAKAVSKAAAAAEGHAGAGDSSGTAAEEGQGRGQGAEAPGSGKVGKVEAGGMTLDLEKLGRLERLAAQLSPAEAAAVSRETVPAGEEQRPGQAEQNGSGAAWAAEATGAGRGPTLPPRPQARPQANGAAAAAEAGKGPETGGSGGGAEGSTARSPPASTSGRGNAAEVCSQLRALLKDDDACCVYLRECGGLRTAAELVAKWRPGEGEGAPADLAALLLLLNDACMNDGNLKQLPALKVLPGVVAALGGAAEEEVAAAAVTLLCTAVTNEDVRREVSKLLGAGDAMSRLIRLLATAKPVVQGIALALLGNCMVDKPTKAAAGVAWRTDAAASDCFLALLRSTNAVLAEKAAVLLGNMATDAALRADILGRHGGGVVRQLVALAAAGVRQGSVTGAASDLQRAAGTALFNLTVDGQGQQLVAEDAEGLTRLFRLTAPPHADRALAARAAGVCARAAKVPAGAALLTSLGAVAGMVGTVESALEGLGLGAGGSSSKSSASGAAAAAATGAAGAAAAADAAGKDKEANGALLDAAVRTLTILTSPDDPKLSAQLLSSGAAAALLRVVRCAGGAPGAVGESVLANAALCLAGPARRKELLPGLRELDPVPALLKVAYEGRGNTASKNAAIALARLAHDPGMLEQLRELHGIEIIYQYVKP